MAPSSLNTVTHLAGFGAGIALYGLLAVMTRRAVRQGDQLSFATAGLGLAWNTGALVVFGVEELGTGQAPGWISVLAYGALGFLPAVAVHAAGVDLLGRVKRLLIRGAYGVSSAVAMWHGLSLLQGDAVPTRAAMLLLTAGYLVLIAGLLAASRAGPTGRHLSTVALAVFAVMALHLSSHGESRDTWVAALIGHHASLPLAFAILYQDYRFALADVFLKRALSIVVMASLAAILLSGIALPWLEAAGTVEPSRTLAILGVLTLWVASALAAPAVLRGVSRFVDRILLRRRDPAEVLEPLVAALRDLDSIETVLATGSRGAAAAITAQASRVEALETSVAHATTTLSERGTRAEVTIPTVEAPGFVLVVEQLAGGRRLLSEDGQLLEAIATALGRRIDALRVTQERVARDLREESLLRLTSEAELQALRAQLQPHFLFNALTTLGYLVEVAPDRARATLYRLTSLLRAVLYRSAGEQTTLGEEMGLVEDYLAIEAARFEERLTVDLRVPATLRDLRVPPLVLQTLVENAIKHGISPLARGGAVRITASYEAGGLTLVVEDSGRGTATATTALPQGSGVGLQNLARRLERLYGPSASLQFRSAPDEGTSVAVRIPARPGVPDSLRIAS